jgi:hypothetical protein
MADGPDYVEMHPHLGDSRNHPAVQLADVIAGTAVTLFSKGLPGCNTIVDSIGRHGHGHSILPDMDIIDPSNRSAAVNALILYDLAKRAEQHADPYENLEAMYHTAEVSWVRGDYDLIRKGRFDQLAHSRRQHSER